MDKATLPAGETLRFDTYRDRQVASCLVCGGKYRPQGGECIHEHPAQMPLSAGQYYRGDVCRTIIQVPGATKSKTLLWCGLCGADWRPGHTCIPQPTAAELRDLAEMGSVLRLMDEIMGQLVDELSVAAPAAWEAM